MGLPPLQVCGLRCRRLRSRRLKRVVLHALGLLFQHEKQTRFQQCFLSASVRRALERELCVPGMHPEMAFAPAGCRGAARCGAASLSPVGLAAPAFPPRAQQGQVGK